MATGGSGTKPQVIIKIRRKKAHGGGHHGGAWKVAYADFITCMFALFMVLWLLTQADLQLRQQIARYFRNSSVLPGGAMLGETAEQAKTEKPRPLEAQLTIVQNSGDDLEALRGRAREIEKTVAESPGLQALRENVRVQVTEEGLEIQVVDSGTSGRKDLLFDISSAGLKPALVELLGALAEQLGKLPNRIEIGGHTDSRLYARGSGMTNWDLSFARADSARKVMEASGLYPRQVLRVTAYADSKLLVEDDPLADENRRLSILARHEKPPGEKQEAAQGGSGAARDAHRVQPFVSPGTPPA